MAGSLVLNLEKYSIFVRVLAGEGDGTLIYVDARGHIHVVGGGGDPLQQREKLQAAVKQIEAGVTAFHTAAGEIRA
jgi:hypothetical protein